MRKLIKKSLACCLVVVLTLTAMVGAFATSAESVATVTAANVEVENGKTSVEVPVTIEVTDGFYAAYIQVASEFGALTAVSVPADADYDVTADGYTAVDLATGKMLVMSIYGDDLRNDMTSAVINCTFTADSAPAAGTYAVTVTCPDVDVPAADWAESVVALTPVDGVITVAEPTHVCTPAEAVKENVVEATCYSEGSYDSVVYCSDAECGKELSRTPVTVPVIDHTPAEAVVENNVDATCYAEGSYDSVVYCSVAECKAEISRTPITVPVTDHTPAEAVVENNVDATCYAEGSYDSVVYCSVAECKHEISRTPVTVEKIAHTPAEAVEENRVEAQPGVAGSYDSVVYCSVPECKAEISRTSVEIPALPVEPVVDETLVYAAKPSVVYGTASIEVSFRIANTVLAKYPDIKMVIIPQRYDTTTLNLVENPAEIVVNKEDLVKAGSTRMQYYFKDSMLYELGLDINYMLRAYDADGNLVAVSETFTTSVAEYLKTNILASTDAKYKTMATDTLIVCDTVMKNVAVNYPDSDLAKATSVIEGFDISAASQTVGAYNTVNNFNSYDSDFTQVSGALHEIRSSVQVEKVAFINFRITDSKKVLDLNKLVVKVSYTSKDSAGEHPYSEEFTGSDFTYAGKFINLKFDQVGIHDSNKDILFEVTYDGVPMCDWTYSVETYLGANQNASNGTMIVALLKLGQSFRAYQNL